jgi:RHS repeat-associated protein
MGFFSSGDTWGPDGAHYDSQVGTTTDAIRRYDRIRPRSLWDTHPAAQQLSYEGSSTRVTQISDGATPINSITLQRTTGVVTRIVTSDGRGWDVGSDPVTGWITSIDPDSGKGKRSYVYNGAGRVTHVKDANDQVMYEFVYANDLSGNPTVLTTERRYIQSESALRDAVIHEEVGAYQLRRKEYTTTGEFRQHDFFYDSTNELGHRLAKMREYRDVNGAGPAYDTVYAHDINKPAGSMVLTQVTLPDATTISYEYDHHLESGTVHFGLPSKATHTGPGGSLVTYDADWDFFYNSGSTWLYWRPRIITQRDGRGYAVQYQYEEGGEDQDLEDRGDGLNGEMSNDLLRRSGPTITQGYSGTRSPETRYYYHNSGEGNVWSVLKRVEIDYASGMHRDVAYEYDDLLRRTTETVAPGGSELVTEYQYTDDETTQDRIVIDPDDYWSRTQFDPDGRVSKAIRYLTPGGGTGNFYQTENVYDLDGRPSQQRVDNKDQDGDPIPGETNPIITDYTYDRLGRLTRSVVDPAGIGQETNYEYNWQDDLTRRYDTSDRGVERAYDGRGLVASETPLKQGQSGPEPETALRLSFAHDEVGRVVETDYENLPARESLTVGYDDFGRLAARTRNPGTDGGQDITTSFEYDDAGNPTRTTVAENGVILADQTHRHDEGGFRYESRRRLVAGSDSNVCPACDPVSRRKFDWVGNVIEERSLAEAAGGDMWFTFELDDANRLVTTGDSEGGETTVLRDGRGNVTTRTVKLDGQNSALVGAEYDALSRATKLTQPEDQNGNRAYTEMAYDSRRNLREETPRTHAGAPLMKSRYAYDNAGRRIEEALLADAADPNDPPLPEEDRVVRFEYNADGRLERGITFNNLSSTQLVTRHDYDALGRLTKITAPSTGSVYTEYVYAADGRLDRLRLEDAAHADEATIAFDYDGHDRVTVQTALGSGPDPDRVSNAEYDGLDRVTLMCDPRSIEHAVSYDLAGRRTAFVEDLGGTETERLTEFTFDRLDRVIQRTAVNENSSGVQLQETRYAHDSLGRTTVLVYPDSTDPPDESCTDCVKLAYDLAGRLTARTKQEAANPVDFAYDDRGLLLSRESVDFDTRDEYTYDALGRVLSAGRGTPADPEVDAFATRAYTDLGYIDLETQSIQGRAARGVTFGHDQLGNRLATTYPGGVSLAYVPTALNRVASIDLNSSPLAEYTYFGTDGPMVRERRTITDGSVNSYYDHALSYDIHRNIGGITNSWQPETGPAETIAEYAYTYDGNRNPLLQDVLDGMPGFLEDNRGYTVDALDRLSAVEYFDPGVTEATTLDLVGNRESHTNRGGETTPYGPVNEGNEYPTIDSVTVVYDDAGNLIEDEEGREYEYDERDRLVEVRADGGSPVLARYTYDGLGRRVAFEDPVAGRTTLYYYDDASVIEERDGNDARVAYHVNGAQFVDERIMTYTDPTGGLPGGAYTYYLQERNFSVVGTGDAEGAAIEHLDFSPGGDFAQGCTRDPAWMCDGDVDGNGAVNPVDSGLVQANYCNPGACTDEQLCQYDMDCNGAINPVDTGLVLSLFGTCNAPRPVCESGGEPPPSGTFTLHGRPLDVLSDGHALLYVRARYYDPARGRWLQRDPSGYVDGNNLYEAFQGNPLTNVDPTGEGILTGLLVDDYGRSDVQFIRQGGLGQAARGFVGGGAQAAGNVAIGAAKGARELAFVVVDIVVAPVDIASTLLFHEPLGRPLSQVGQAATNPDNLGLLIVETGARNVANAVTLGGSNIIEGTVLYARTGDAEALAQNVGGQGFLALGTVGAIRVAPHVGATIRAGSVRAGFSRLNRPATTALAVEDAGAVRFRVLANIAESRAARAASGFEIFVARERALASTVTAGGGALPVLNAEFMPRPQVAQPILQQVATQEAAQLAADLERARLVLSRPELQAARLRPDVARLSYGKAVERLVSRKIRGDPLLRTLFDPAGIGRRGPDILGIGPAHGLRFDITTASPRAVAAHLARPYGQNLIIITYERPSTFTVFPP